MKVYTTSCLLLFLALALVFFSKLSFAQTQHLIPFELEDQFGKTYTNESFNNRMMVMIGSDGGGSKYNRKWGKAISDDLKKDDNKYNIDWVGLADLRSAPFFMKGYIRNQFSDDEKEWVLMDWDGLFAETYAFEDSMSNILVFDSSGKLLYKSAVKEVEDEKLNRILKVIRENYR